MRNISIGRSEPTLLLLSDTTMSRATCSAFRAAKRVTLYSRSLATAAPTTVSAKPNFRDTLDEGPSLDDFISGDAPPDRIILGNPRG
jgi:lipoic acid synthetase